MCPGQARHGIRDVIRRSIDNKKANKDPQEGFNDYDKELYAKWPLLQDSIQNVSFTEPEINTFAKYLARQIEDMTISVFVNKYMWVFYWLYLETKHSKGVIEGRAKGFIRRKFGIK